MLITEGGCEILACKVTNILFQQHQPKGGTIHHCDVQDQENKIYGGLAGEAASRGYVGGWDFRSSQAARGRIFLCGMWHVTIPACRMVPMVPCLTLGLCKFRACSAIIMGVD